METGKVKSKKETATKVISLNYNETEKQVFYSTDTSFGNKSKINILTENNESVDLVETKFNPTSIVSFRDFLVFSDELGYVNLVDIRKNEIVKSVKVHDEKICELNSSFCNTFFTTASSDNSSQVIDYELNVQKKFISETPINSSKIFRTNDKLVTAGGIDARDVALTGGKTRFDINFHDIVTTEIVGTYNPHFGTINTIDIHENSKYMVSGGEESIIALIKFGKDFYEAELV